MSEKFTYSNEIGEELRYSVEIELTPHLIKIHLQSRGGLDPSGQIYGDDFPKAVERFFSVLWERNLDIKRIYWNPTDGPNAKLPIEERILLLDWPNAFRELGKKKIRTYLGRQMKSLGGHYQSPFMVEVFRREDVIDLKSAARLIGCILKGDIEHFECAIPDSIEEVERTTPKSIENLGEIFEEEPLGPEGYVYLMTNPRFPGWVKVGKSADTVLREMSYNTGDPYRSYIMRSRRFFVDRHRAERLAHSDMELVPGVERRGEWFRTTLESARAVLSNLNLKQ
jgi:hypothetical protein